MDCECLSGCPFFHDKMAEMPDIADLYKARHCNGDSEGCARHIVFKALGKGTVPFGLFPNQIERARKILEQTNV